MAAASLAKWNKDLRGFVFCPEFQEYLPLRNCPESETWKSEVFQKRLHPFEVKKKLCHSVVDRSVNTQARAEVPASLKWAGKGLVLIADKAVG